MKKMFGSHLFRAKTSLPLGMMTLSLIGITMLGQILAQTSSTTPAAGRTGGNRPPQKITSYEDYTGFTKLWDGETLNNWEGETDVWSVDHGALHADTTKTPGQHHIYYVGPTALMDNFDLKVEVKLSAEGANGGIQYRSRLLGPGHRGSLDDPLGTSLPPNVHTLDQAVTAGITSVSTPSIKGTLGPNPDANCPVPPSAVPPAMPGGASARPPTAPNPWQVSGYQFDMDSPNLQTGQLYEGQARGNVGWPGQFVLLQPCREIQVLGTVNLNPAAAMKPSLGWDGEWNQLEVIAKDNTLVHIINGQVVALTIDNSPKERPSKGIIGVQLEGKGQIWYRNIYVKKLSVP